MKLNPESEIPLFVQIANLIKEQILLGIYKEEDKVPSVNDIAIIYKINPHTVLKGINILVDENILYKKRGLGMFVKEGAIQIIKSMMNDIFINENIIKVVQQAKKLNISLDDLLKLIERGYKNE